MYNASGHFNFVPMEDVFFIIKRPNISLTSMASSLGRYFFIDFKVAITIHDVVIDTTRWCLVSVKVSTHTRKQSLLNMIF